MVDSVNQEKYWCAIYRGQTSAHGIHSVFQNRVNSFVGNVGFLLFSSFILVFHDFLYCTDLISKCRLVWTIYIDIFVVVFNRALLCSLLHFGHCVLLLSLKSRSRSLSEQRNIDKERTTNSVERRDSG